MSLPLPGVVFTINVPLQVEVLPLQLPELAATDMLVYVPPTRSLQFGALGTPVQVRSLVTDVDVPLLPVQVTAGDVIAVPAEPIAGTLPQVSVYVGAATVIVPEQLAVWLIPPQVAVAVT